MKYIVYVLTSKVNKNENIYYIFEDAYERIVDIRPVFHHCVEMMEKSMPAAYRNINDYEIKRKIMTDKEVSRLKKYYSISSKRDGHRGFDTTVLPTLKINRNMEY